MNGGECERPRESVNPSAPNNGGQLIWSQNRDSIKSQNQKPYTFPTCKKGAKTAKHKPSNVGEVSKMKHRGSRIVNKWKRRGEELALRVWFSWESWRPINFGATARERTGQFSLSIGETLLVQCLRESRNSPFFFLFLSRCLVKFLREIKKWVFLSIFLGKGRGTCTSSY